MSWNYRVMEFTDLDGERYREIREVYYADNGKPNAYSAVAATVMSNDVDEGEDSQGRKLGLVWVLDRMRDALDKPILTESDFSASQQLRGSVLRYEDPTDPIGGSEWVPKQAIKDGSDGILSHKKNPLFSDEESLQDAIDKKFLSNSELNMPAKLLPPPGFENWLDYVVATTAAARDINIQSLFNTTPWGREVSRQEVTVAINAELETLRVQASRKRLQE